jgi:hypothetical protein
MEANPTAAQPLPAREYVITAEQPALAITVAELEEWRRTLVADPYVCDFLTSLVHGYNT